MYRLLRAWDKPKEPNPIVSLKFLGLFAGGHLQVVSLQRETGKRRVYHIELSIWSFIYVSNSLLPSLIL